VAVCRCGADRWSDCSACYRCLKERAGLTSHRNGFELTDREQLLIGVAPKWERDPRAVAVERLFEWETSEWSRYDGADRATLAALVAISGGEERLELP
jgi:hypothetical protein